MLVVAGFGWAKPVPIDPYAVRRRTPAGTMLVSVAGPFSNLLLAITASIPIRMGLIQYSGITSRILPSAAGFLYEFILINLLLMLFNLIPLFPLDGEKALEYYIKTHKVDPEYEEAADQLQQHHFEQEEWDEAEPLLDMLVGKADKSDRRRMLRLCTQLGMVARNLKDADVVPAIDRVVRMLARRFGGELR